MQSHPQNRKRYLNIVCKRSLALFSNLEFQLALDTVKAVREVQMPVHYKPHGFPGLDEDIISFAKTGRLAPNSATCIEAFIALQMGTSLGRKYAIDRSVTSGKLYVSCQFTRTVEAALNRPLDQFQVSCTVISSGSFSQVIIWLENLD
jgi:hypothetical protein